MRDVGGTCWGSREASGWPRCGGGQPHDFVGDVSGTCWAGRESGVKQGASRVRSAGAGGGRGGEAGEKMPRAPIGACVIASTDARHMTVPGYEFRWVAGRAAVRSNNRRSTASRPRNLANGGEKSRAAPVCGLDVEHDGPVNACRYPRRWVPPGRATVRMEGSNRRLWSSHPRRVMEGGEGCHAEIVRGVGETGWTGGSMPISPATMESAGVGGRGSRRGRLR